MEPFDSYDEFEEAQKKIIPVEEAPAIEEEVPETPEVPQENVAEEQKVPQEDVEENPAPKKGRKKKEE